MQPALYLAVLGFSSLALAGTPVVDPLPRSPASTPGTHRVFGLFQSENLTVDLKAIDSSKGNFGIDYRFDFSRSLRLDASTGQRWDFIFRGQGFLVTDSAKSELDSLVTEAALVFFPLWRVVPPALPTPEQISDDASDVETVLRVRPLVKELGSPLSLYADVHAKYETTQDGNDRDFAFGAAAAVTTSYLNPVLDFPFRFLRFGEEGKRNNPRQFDLSAGYEYVTGREGGLRKEQGEINRLTARAEWETGIFLSDRVSFAFVAHYDLDGPSADGKFHPFFQAKYEHLLVDAPHAKTSFAIKYTAGELPPNFDAGQVLGAGFSIVF